MSIVKTWGYGSNAAADTAITPSSIPAATGYGKVQDEPTEARLSKQQAPDNREMITYGCKDIGSVGSFLKSVHPLSVKTGVQYEVRVDEQLLLTESTVPTYAETIPVVMTLTIRHPKNNNLTESDIETVFKRLIGACYKEVSGTVTPRFGDLMQSILVPTSDGIDAAS